MINIKKIFRNFCHTKMISDYNDTKNLLNKTMPIFELLTMKNLRTCFRHPRLFEILIQLQELKFGAQFGETFGPS